MAEPSPGGTADVATLLSGPRFEVVPLPGVEAETTHLPPGATVTVTCSPRRGVDATVDLAARMARRGFRSVPHLAARLVRSRAHLEDIVGRLVDAGVVDVFVIGGDPPHPVGPYEAAGPVLEALAELGGPFPDMGVAGYPERHPLIPEALLDRALLDKQRLATYVVTQICFDPEALLRWVARVRSLGIHLPVHAGVPGAVTRRKLLEIGLRIGIGDSIRYLSKHGGLVARLVRRGTYRPDAFLTGLSGKALDLAGFHLNTFNQIRGTERWRRRAVDTYRAEAVPEDSEGA